MSAALGSACAMETIVVGAAAIASDSTSESALLENRRLTGTRVRRRGFGRRRRAGRRRLVRDREIDVLLQRLLRRERHFDRRRRKRGYRNARRRRRLLVRFRIFVLGLGRRVD